ncbi:DEAD/DEAH box helicase [Brevibacillus sp. H7]|uniref:DEAD/DEAH box helicase n=1 Tax=Brevibacillus sp. H7 TaxID=3349138 RepID=UPI003825F727
MSTTFAELQLSEPLLQVLSERGMKKPTPVQAEAIPAILSGKDALVESPTGTGKTLAYLLPLLSRWDAASKELQVLILAPTHELVMQIAREAETLLAKTGGSVVPIIGGVDPKRQLERLKKHPSVIAATPGRLLELIEQRKVKIHTVKTVVIDEADRMLDQGFFGPVQEVLKRTMRDTQRLFFSATLPQAIVGMVEPLVHQPVVIRAKAPENGHGVMHFYMVSEDRKKVDTLRRLLRLVNAKASIVFVNEIERVDEIVSKLKYHHLECRLLHRDASKEERALTLQQFRAGKFPVLITTDIAARGIDIQGVECVVHFDPAADADAYVHRSGRTGRMGAAGLVFSIITPQERFIIRKFAKQTGISIEEKAMSHGTLVDPQELRRPKPGTKPIHKKSRFGTK